ncbi:MAG: T9SS type A sorting domain-containing protein [Saprospiraceae bacterium]|nr:T9SS type A sorting domain-containing protein [Saprospiraceae bacterium]
MKNATLCFLFLLYCHFSVAQAIIPDSSFGNFGCINTSLSGNYYPYGQNFVLTPDGGVAVIGGHIAGMRMHRYDPYGTHLPSAQMNYPELSDYSIGITIQPDNKTIVCAREPSAPFHQKVIRMLPDGSFDPDFGENGVVTVPSAFTLHANLLMQPDGKIVLFGTEDQAPTGTQSMVVRFEPDGSLDTTFGDNGYVRVDAINNSLEIFFSGAILADGKMLFAGMVRHQAYFIKLMPNGDLDPSFSLDGIHIEPLNGSAEVYGMVAMPDGKYLATGYTIPDYEAFVARYNANGHRDQSFGVMGAVYFPELSEGVDLAILPDGKILALNWIAYNDGQIAVLTRLMPDGELDPAFGNQGYYTLDLEGHRPQAMEVHENQVIISTQKGKIYLHRLLLDLHAGILSAAAPAETAPLIYPNPVGEQCNLQFALTEKSAVGIHLYDMQGKLIRTFRENDRFEPGEHTLQLDFPAHIPAGNYILQLDLNGRMAKAIKMVR